MGNTIGGALRRIRDVSRETESARPLDRLRLARFGPLNPFSKGLLPVRAGAHLSKERSFATAEARERHQLGWCRTVPSATEVWQSKG